MAIEGSVLYNTLEARWKDHALWPGVLQSLNVADNVPGFVDHNANSIDSAMTWARSPQGQNYWIVISRIDNALANLIKRKEVEYAAVYK